MKPTVAIILDTRRLSAAGYHIKIRVTFCEEKKSGKRWIQKYYKTGHYASEDEFASIIGKPRIDKLKTIRDKVKNLESKAIGIIEKYEADTIHLFELHYLNTGSIEHIEGLFNVKIKTLEESGKISTAEKYTTALKVISDYAGGSVAYGEVTPKWLSAFRAAYIKRGRSIASFAFHARALRHIFKTAISLRVIEPGMYPFGPGKFVIPSVRRPLKRYLTPDEKDLFLSYVPAADHVRRAHDYWIFSYFCNGMNFADIANLKRKDIFPEYILIYRQKTIDVDHNKEKIVIPLRPEILAVITRQANPTLKPDDYVFPVLKEGMSEKEKFFTIRRFVLKTNKALDVIRRDLKFNDKVTTYTARHTFSNQMIDAGESTELLQAQLGHKDLRTTEHYKAGFAIDKLKKAAENL